MEYCWLCKNVEYIYIYIPEILFLTSVYFFKSMLCFKLIKNSKHFSPQAHSPRPPFHQSIWALPPLWLAIVTIVIVVTHNSHHCDVITFTTAGQFFHHYSPALVCVFGPEHWFLNACSAMPSSPCSISHH